MNSAAILVVTLFLFSGCQKIQDHYDIEGNKNELPCKLISVSYEINDNPVSIIYYYDNEGKPTEIFHDDPFGEEYSEFFTYDQMGRLIEYDTYIYAGEDKVFAYEGNSLLPVRDTAQDIWGRLWIESFEYDQAGRIIVFDRRWFSSPEGLDDDLGVDPENENQRIYYYYDVRGNRQFSPLNRDGYTIGPIQYSDQPNVNSLHPVFQLLNKDYSKHSYLHDGLTFNEYGLPLTFQKSSVVNVYDCD